MIVKRGMSPRQLIQWSGYHMFWMLGWAAIVAGLYDLILMELKKLY